VKRKWKGFSFFGPTLILGSNHMLAYRRLRRAVTVVVGGQWGDEGKGKLVDALAGSFDVVARFNGGANAGHTVVYPDGRVFKLHLLPSGVVQPKTLNLLGNGMVIDPEALLTELQGIQKQGVDWSHRVFVSDRAHLVFPFHQALGSIAGRQEEECHWDHEQRHWARVLCQGGADGGARGRHVGSG